MQAFFVKVVFDFPEEKNRKHECERDADHAHECYNVELDEHLVEWQRIVQIDWIYLADDLEKNN